MALFSSRETEMLLHECSWIYKLLDIHDNSSVIKWSLLYLLYTIGNTNFDFTYISICTCGNALKWKNEEFLKRFRVIFLLVRKFWVLINAWKLKYWFVEWKVYDIIKTHFFFFWCCCIDNLIDQYISTNGQICLQY